MICVIMISSNHFVKFVKKHPITNEIMNFSLIVLLNFAIITAIRIKQSKTKQIYSLRNESFFLRFRCLGLRGHHALIKKTANDELQNDVWKHMDKIVPSIVFNMEVREQDRQSTPYEIFHYKKKPNFLIIIIIQVSHLHHHVRILLEQQHLKKSN